MSDFKKYWQETIAAARAMDWTGFTNKQIGMKPGTKVFDVTKPADREWPDSILVALWCDNFCVNFGHAWRETGPNTARVWVDFD